VQCDLNSSFELVLFEPIAYKGCAKAIIDCDWGAKRELQEAKDDRAKESERESENCLLNAVGNSQ
jgi:hypothetical protein